MSDVLAKDVRISSTTEGKFSINYFDMLPFKKYRVYFDSETEITDEKSLENFEINPLFHTY